MAKISSYQNISSPRVNDRLIGTDANNLNETKNFLIGDLGPLYGLPYSHTQEVTTAQLLTASTIPITIMNPVATGQILAVDKIYVKMTGGADAFDFTQDLGIALQNTNVFISRSYTLASELLNTFTVPDFVAYRELVPMPNTVEGGIGLIYAQGGGLGLAEAAGLYMQTEISGANPTQGSGTMTVLVYYRLFDTDLQPITTA